VGESDYFHNFSNDAVTVSVDESTYTGLEQLHGNLHTKGAHENNNNNTTPICIGLHKTKQKTWMIQSSASKEMNDVPKQMYFNE
jgi:hypothetical protein